MGLIQLIQREIFHRWKTSLLFVLMVASITCGLAFFSVNKRGFEREITRNVRDIGSNIIILPAEVDQLEYHAAGGYSERTMPEDVVAQLIEFRASLNHLIPMLERRATVSIDSTRVVSARVVGIAASIAMPGRPKAPMQKTIKAQSVQLGSQVAAGLGIGRDDKPDVSIAGRTFKIDRVNRSNGTWQDAAVLMDLKIAQELFSLPNHVSRIEAIECTSEKCAATGLKSETILQNELAGITDRASLLRREKMATARSGIRTVSSLNLKLLQNVFWILLAATIAVLSAVNSLQRQSETGIFQALGYHRATLTGLFVGRSAVLTIAGAALGLTAGAYLAYFQSSQLFIETGKKLTIEWMTIVVIGIFTMVVAMLASGISAAWTIARNPAELIGKDN